MKKWIFLLLGIFLFFAFVERLIKFLGDIPDPTQLTNYTPSLTTKIYDNNGEIIAELFTEKRTVVPLSQIPKNMLNAVIAIEDTRFFKHWGIDPYRIAGAFVSNLKAGNVVEGGSTITQQLAKIIFLTRRKTLARKIKEVILAIQLERDYSKYEILEMYLNQIYFGNGAYGVATAAKVHFGKNVSDLTLAECALLAGIPKAPSMYSPLKNPEMANKRKSTVLMRMRDVGFITDEQKRKAEEENILISPPHTATKIAPYFIDNVRQTLEAKYGSSIYQDGLEIYTTLDRQLQIAAESIVERHLSEFDCLLSKSTTPVEGALICLDVKTGEVRALVGGRNFQKSQFNRALQAKRQPGSAFKVFVYTAALENGFTPTSIIDDSPSTYCNKGRDWELLSNTTDFSDVTDKIFLNELIAKNSDAIRLGQTNEQVLWQPQNYSEKFHGSVLLRKALEHSLNICAIKVAEKIGPKTVADYARRLGIESPLTETISLALGSSDVTLKEMVSAFGCLANAGIKTNPYLIRKVVARNGRTLEEYFPEEKDAISTQTAFLITNLLRGVVEHGTGVYAKRLKRPSAGKTGTTNDCQDAWFIGYTPQLVTGVWVGYDDHKTLGDKMTGGRLACPIWTEFMSAALRKQPIVDFSIPSDITFVKINPGTGLLAIGNPKGTYLEAFLNGTEPKEFCITGSSITSQGVVKKLEDETAPQALTNLTENTTISAPVIPLIQSNTEGGF